MVVMAWIESHQELGDHPKVHKLAHLLGCGVPQAIGHLHLLWHWALTYAEDGDLSDFDDFDIARAARWDGDAERFKRALVGCGPGQRPGFVEPGGALHDWWEYAGKLVERRRKDRDRKRAARGGGETSEAVQGTSDGHPVDVSESPGRTVPNRTVEQPPRSNPLSPDGDDAPLSLAVQHVEPQGIDLDDLRDTYPRHPDSGKPWGGAAKLDVVKAWAKLTPAERRACVPAVRHYAEACGRAGGDRPKHMSTWLNARGWEDWQTPAQPAGLAVRNGQGRVASNVARTEANRDVIRGILGRAEAG